ncbi:peptide-methionine (S)-S-oxide reductase [Mucilaginibacter auburnensis]|uniref:Peptide methionine sulfoxide reductase MsrA n=2 Tax=Mucilaginibacter auburnensis TaxID=1457233 RepID=A0A2H9VLF9_9SPHI|nr:peptide-methionine (S)-S-oxide reductase [Mucilaginibacter auburnensis]
MMCFGCASAQDDDTLVKVPAPKPGKAVATFAAGCFWASQEAMSELKGVEQVIAGYSGGKVPNPTYEDVCTEATGHAEAVQVYYDPKVITYEELVTAFFYAHDPTTLNRQGPDEGTSYRSAIFYRTPEEKAIVQKVIKEVNASKHYKDPIVTQVSPFTAFYGGEAYHQGYYRVHQDRGYIRTVSVPKVMKMRKAVPQLLKPEFKK